MDFRKCAKPRAAACGTIPVEECLAKTRIVSREGSRCVEKGCDLYTHLWTTCRVLQEIQRQWTGYPLHDLIPAAALWLAALHDIGKASPGFLSKICEALGLPTPWSKHIEELPGGHACSSEVALEELFGEKFARLAGRHHGRGRRLGPQDSLESDVLGGEAWQNLRCGIIERLRRELPLPKCDLKNIPKEQGELVLGAAVLADWLSSGMDLPYGAPLPDAGRIERAVRDAGFLPVEWRRGLGFEQMFGFPANPLQRACEELAQPGSVIVIESGMGSGKTEAALSLAYQLLSAKRADGLYFAMPTKLTSEKIFDRLNAFLQRGLAEGAAVEPLKIHGDSWLDWSLPEGDENGLETRRNGSWFQSKKRALLAPFAAGTVDQALLSVINVRHRALRAFALAGKVVVLDEVHSYDSYTGSLIVSLVEQIRAWGGTVIVLSATLTAAARARLLGCDGEKATVLSESYPLISVSTPGSSSIEEIAIPAAAPVSVALRHSADEAAALCEALERARRGEEVLWIENTVNAAQEVFRQLNAMAGGGMEIGLIHSRFPMCRRQREEDRWVRLLGRNGGEERRRCGRVLVATQVLEQSVDVDADFLISRLAPGDMLFQRLGRLWRHPGVDALRPPSARREALILIPPGDGEPEDKESFCGAALPYDPYWVLRTLRVWRELASVSLPSDIRPLLERIYADEEETGLALDLKHSMRKNRESLEQQARIALGTADKPADDDTATTRVSDRPEVQLLLIRKGNLGFSLRERVAVLFADEPIVLPAADSPAGERLAAVKALLRCMLKVPEHLAPSYAEFETEPFLGALMWTGDGESRPVRAAYVDESGRLLTKSCSATRQECFYHEKLGYCAAPGR